MNELPKPQMQFKASIVGNEALIQPVCPHSHAWFESMGKRYIKPNELHWVGKMGIELAIVDGHTKRLQKELGEDKISPKGILKGKFDMLDYLKK